MAAGHAHGALGGKGAVIGLEWAGEVAGVGSGVTGMREGDRVMCSGNGGYAEYAVTDWGRVSPLPANNMGWEQAATLPIALQTMHDAMVTNGRFQTGDAVLIQGASSGVGLMGLQIAKLLGARLVIGTSTHAGAPGAAGGVRRRSRRRQRRPGLARRRAEGDGRARRGPGGGPGLRPGRARQPAGHADPGPHRQRRPAGRRHGAFDFDLHAARRISYVGVTFRTRSVDEVREINRRMREDLWDAVRRGHAGAARSTGCFPLAEAREAQAHMRDNGHLGKIVLAV